MNKAYAVVLTKDCDDCSFGSMMICDTFHDKKDAENYISNQASEYDGDTWEYINRHQILELGIH